MSTSTAAQMAGVSNTVALEQAWQVIMSHFAGGVSDIVVPNTLKPFLGDSGIDVIAQRYSELVQSPALVFFDETVDGIRMTPSTPGLCAKGERDISADKTALAPGIGSTSVTASAVLKKQHGPVQSKQDKVPRPPNPFILYRQHHHPLLKQAHPEMHNNEISVILGNQWKAESEETKNHFKEMADAVKQQHQQSHPDYQYQPRKPSEKKRRMTRRKAVALGLTSDPLATTEASTAEASLARTSVQAAASSAPPEAEIDIIPEFSAIAIPDSNLPTEAQDTAVVGPSAPPALGAVRSDGKGSQGWVDEGGDILAAELPLDSEDAALYELLNDFNRRVPTPASQPITFDFPDVPLGSRLAAKTQFEEEFIFSMVDWEKVEQEAAEIKDNLAAEHSLLEGH